MEKSKKNRNLSNIKTIVVAIFLVAIVLFYFQHLSNKSAERKTKEQKGELESLCKYDMAADYPKTPRDVIKLHLRYLKVFYGQSVDDDELEQLNDNVRCLYAKELLWVNPENESLDSLKKSISSMKENKYIYKTYELPEASQIAYYEQGNKKMATAQVKLNVSVDGKTGFLYVQYVLVNEDEQWKLLAWGDPQTGNAAN